MPLGLSTDARPTALCVIQHAVRQGEPRECGSEGARETALRTEGETCNKLNFLTRHRRQSKRER